MYFFVMLCYALCIYYSIYDILLFMPIYCMEIADVISICPYMGMPPFVSIYGAY